MKFFRAHQCAETCTNWTHGVSTRILNPFTAFDLCSFAHAKHESNQLCSHIGMANEIGCSRLKETMRGNRGLLQQWDCVVAIACWLVVTVPVECTFQVLWR